MPTHVTNATTTSMSAAVAHSQPSTPHRRKGSREAVLPTLSVSLDGEDEGAEEHEAGFVNSANQSPSPTYRQGNAGWQAYNELEHGHEHEHEQGSPSSQHALGARGSNNGRNGGYNYSPDEGDETVYEELDAVPELGNGRYGPSPSSSSSSLLSASNSGSSLYTAPSGSPMKPASQMTAAERREHSRRHSRVHSRNLSVFFPRPGTEAQDEADVARASAVFGNGNVGDTPPRPQLHVDTLGTGPAELGGISPTKARRGHHHKHSVSFAMFEDPSPAGSSSVSPSPLYDPSPAHEHAAFLRSEPAPAHSASPDPVFLPSLPPLPSEQRGLAIFGFLHFVLGAALWVAGQAGDSLAATGLGYLVVFDALGVLSAVGAGISAAQWRREQDRRAANSTMGMMGKEKMQDDGVRRPYG